MKELLDISAIDARLQELPGWHRVGDSIAREFTFKDFAEALGFVNRVGALAEAAGHHPDIEIRWNKVRLVLTTHSRGGLTELDFQLAAQIQALA